MKNNVKCWKNIDKIEENWQKTIHVGSNDFALKVATEEEIKKGSACLKQWIVEKRYEVLTSGLNVSTPYINWKTERVEIAFEELIFYNGECVGICHEECIMLFNDKSTHLCKKFLGEFPTGPDRTRYVYDYYELMNVQPL